MSQPNGVNMMTDAVQNAGTALQQMAPVIRPPYEIAGVVDQMLPSNFGESLDLKNALNTGYRGLENFTLRMGEAVSHNGSFLADIASAVKKVVKDGTTDIMAIQKQVDTAHLDIDQMDSKARRIQYPVLPRPDVPPALLQKDRKTPIQGTQPGYWRPDDAYQHPKADARDKGEQDLANAPDFGKMAGVQAP